MKKSILLFRHARIAILLFPVAISAQQLPCHLICNLDFELPVISLAPGLGSSVFIPKCDVPCWNTTNTETAITNNVNCIVGVMEFWKGTSGSISPHSGSQFIELNARTQAKLYQDFTAVPGSSLSISYWTAGRAGYPNNMRVSIATSITDPSPHVLRTSVGTINTWTQYSDSYTFPLGGGTQYTVIFETLDPGEGGNFLDDITLDCSPPPVVQANLCCPPWDKDVLASMMYYSGNGQTNGSYTLNFHPTALFNIKMHAYLTYMNLINPLITELNIAWRLTNQSTHLNVGSQVYGSWTIGATAPFNPILTNPGFFNLPIAYPMLPGIWYKIHTGIYVNNSQTFFSFDCANNDMYCRIPGIVYPPRELEFSYDGKKVVLTIPIIVN